MSLLDEARDSRVKIGGTCGVALLDAATQAEINEALEDPEIETTSIARALRKRDIAISASTLGRHDRRDCQCRR